MNLDSRVKRYFPLIVCAMIAGVAYFQAAGIGDMVASTIGDAPPTKPVTGAARTERKEPVSGKPILSRNPFDSETGPLDGTPMPTPKPDDAETAPTDPGDPQDAPACDFGRVVLIMATDDPEWSFASIQTGGDPPKLRRVGDEVKEHTIELVSWNRVWMIKGGNRCQMRLGDKKATPAPKKRPRVPRKRRRRRRSAKLPDELRKKITKISDTEFQIERSVVDAILDRQAELMRYTRLRPMKEGDKVIGLRVSRIRPDSLLDVLGVKNGDAIKSINGFELTNPQRALEAYGRLRTADKLSLTLIRGGKPVTIDFRIQ